MDLYSQINNVINTAINNYSDKIVETFDNVSKQELSEIWKQVCNNSQYNINPTKSAPEISKPSPVNYSPVNSTSSTIGSTTGTCPYIITRGRRSGDECGVKTRGGKTYCSKHKKFEHTVKETKVEQQSTNDDSDKTPIEEIQKSPPKKIISYNKKVQKYVHKDSGLVFKSDKEKQVIGYLNSANSTVLPLDYPNIEKCKQLGFQIYNRTPTIEEARKLKPKCVKNVSTIISKRELMELCKTLEIIDYHNKDISGLRKDIIDRQQTIMGVINNDDSDSDSDSDDDDDQIKKLPEKVDNHDIENILSEINDKSDDDDNDDDNDNDNDDNKKKKSKINQSDVLKMINNSGDDSDDDEKFNQHTVIEEDSDDE